MNDVVYPIEGIPASAEVLPVAPGIRWLRMPLPFALDHINLWLIEDGDGWTIVDTGYGNAATQALWEQLFVGPMRGRPVRRVIVTHYHPDHVGSAAWLAERTGAPVWMTETEFDTACAVRAGTGDWARERASALLLSHGLDPTRLSAQETRGNAYARGVPALPDAYRRIQEGEEIEIGGRAWRVIIGRGHAPEHAMLHCAALGILISGDQVLPRITTNVGVWGNNPEADPLGLFLETLTRVEALPASTRVLPSHDRVFEGLHPRIAQLRAHHAARLAELEAACEAPHTAAELLPVLFRRALDDHQLMFAMGETIAHLNHLLAAGRVSKTSHDGVWRFQRTAT